MARSLPERTVDAYLAIAIARRFPNAALWDPTNTPGVWDHTLLAAGKTVLFEAKGNEAGNNGIVIDLAQLHYYLTLPIAPLVFYLLADPPGWNTARHPIAPGFPASTWPTFDRWAYVVPAATLAIATGLRGKTRTLRPKKGVFTVTRTGRPVPSVRLDDFFDELEDCYWVARHRGPLGAGAPAGVLAGRPGPSQPGLQIGDLGTVTEHGVVDHRHEPHAPADQHLRTAVVLHLPA